MDKRVIQISVDIIIDKDSGYDSTMEEDIVKGIENVGYNVSGISFIDDMTEYYKDYLNGINNA